MIMDGEDLDRSLACNRHFLDCHVPCATVIGPMLPRPQHRKAFPKIPKPKPKLAVGEMVVPPRLVLLLVLFAPLVSPPLKNQIQARRPNISSLVIE